MYWAMDDNVRAMTRALQLARDDGAEICAFAELALTGFHRRIVDWARPERSEPAVRVVCDAAARLGIATVFGAPTYGAGGMRRNSHLFVEADGSIVGVVSKIGLTGPEATFFSPGTDRPVIGIAGLRCTAVICREVEDEAHVLRALQRTGVELVFWPGQMRPDPARPAQDPPEHVAQAQALARKLPAFVVQTNWPNALNRPEESAHTGHSACIAPSGELLFRLPREGQGIAVFDLGATTFRWHSMPSAVEGPVERTSAAKGTGTQPT